MPLLNESINTTSFCFTNLATDDIELHHLVTANNRNPAILLVVQVGRVAVKLDRFEKQAVTNIINFITLTESTHEET